MSTRGGGRQSREREGKEKKGEQEKEKGRTHILNERLKTPYCCFMSVPTGILIEAAVLHRGNERGIRETHWSFTGCTAHGRARL